MRVRQHVNPLGVHFEQFRGEIPPFELGRPIEVEIGCAEAHFLFARATRDPDRTYVGLEIREELVDYVNQKARRTRQPVYAVFCQAQLHLSEIFGDSKVARVYINFPDPWFKRRHRERRMIDPALADGIARVAEAGADVFVQTDIWDIALDAMDVFERDDRFVNAGPEWTFWRGGNPYGAKSGRERHAEKHGLPIWRLLYRLGR